MKKPAPRPSAQAIEPSVALVVDPEYGERLQGLVERMPIWALNSTTNRAATEWIWEKDPETHRRITLFDVPDFPVDTQEFIGIVASIDAQRTKHLQPPMRDLEVIGMGVYPDLNGALLEFGFQSVETTVSGFKALGLKRT
ncbi:MAG: hypothetical protein LAN37_08145 [Acidobacteriia bacterium]|nr:hypothetical protein [Terriglobia bacterium]